ncbi:hypothetical protein NDU88_002798 [Pleurodeles waltl]|uniref:Uncharacterized protein n=1 Tax=Pleurodeles waltl TaxID=8319 RepID=A0AAV7TLP9_PLEWA|nr:hypothetical protein NDU88_002798 [Pleurodeles waltl]
MAVGRTTGWYGRFEEISIIFSFLSLLGTGLEVADMHLLRPSEPMEVTFTFGPRFLATFDALRTLPDLNAQNSKQREFDDEQLQINVAWHSRPYHRTGG